MRYNHERQWARIDQQADEDGPLTVALLSLIVWPAYIVWLAWERLRGR